MSSPAENDGRQDVPPRDSGDKRMRKLGIRRICSEAPERSNKRGRPRSSMDATKSPVILGLLATDTMATGSQRRSTEYYQISMEDSSGDDDGTFHKPVHHVRKIKWTEHLIGVFLELFDCELAAINYMQNVPHADGKNRIVQGFKARTGIDLPWESFKHKYDNLRRLYIAWEKLTSYPNVSVDSITGLITMDDQWWKDREMEVPLSKTLHRHPITHIDVMHRVFKNHTIGRDNPPSPNTSVLPTDLINNKASDECVRTHEDLDLSRHANSPLVSSPIPSREPSLSDEPMISVEPMAVRDGDPYPIPNRTNFSRRMLQRDLLESVPCQQPQLVAFKEVITVLNKLDIEKFTDFWWASVRMLKNDVEWRELFVELEMDGEKISFLEGLTGYDRNSNFIGMKGLKTFTGNSNGVINDNNHNNDNVRGL